LILLIQALSGSGRILRLLSGTMWKAETAHTVYSLLTRCNVFITNIAVWQCGLQVISARRGEFETGFERGGQTREHAMLVKTAGVRHLVIVVNKMDDPTVEWEESRWHSFNIATSHVVTVCVNVEVSDCNSHEKMWSISLWSAFMAVYDLWLLNPQIESCNSTGASDFPTYV